MSLFVRLDRASDETLHDQLVAQTRRAILTRQLPAGMRLPATRVLAADLGISRNVIVSAFDELISEGYLEARVGSGTYIAHDVTPLPGGALAVPVGRPRWLTDAPPVGLTPMPGQIDFRLGQPTIAPLPLSVWRGAWRDVLGTLPSATYGPAAGDPALRAAIAAYLGRARGIACGPDDVIVTAGAVQALESIARATLAPGDAVGMEEPGYPEARAVFLSRGARIVPIPVDDDGLRVDALPTGPDAPLLVYVTPSHQYPLGARLPVSRRMALLAWAAVHDSLIIEDDYDSEFRFDAPPLPALAGLDDAGRVAYIGTFSKVLTPSLRAGYLVAPLPLRERIAGLTPETARQTPWPIQRALTHFLLSGDLERHIRRMRRHYAAQRAALHDALAPIAPLAHLQGLEAGLHAYLALRPDLDPASIIARAAARGVTVYSLAPYYLGEPDRNGILLGYGGLTHDAVIRGARALAEAIEDAARGEPRP
ncbi:MAG: PLP-dependent aminotransferase family protein [Thermomicrobiales bacterium]